MNKLAELLGGELPEHYKKAQQLKKERISKFEQEIIDDFLRKIISNDNLELTGEGKLFVIKSVGETVEGIEQALDQDITPEARLLVNETLSTIFAFRAESTRQMMEIFKPQDEGADDGNITGPQG